MTFGLDTNGLEIKRAADIKTELEASFRATFGQAINLDSRSIFGQIIGIVSEREALVWELIEEIYFSQYPDPAEGTSLDNVAAITGTTRKAATKSTGIVTLIGDALTVVPLGSVVSVSGNDASRFVTDAEAIILVGTDEIQTLAFIQIPDQGSFTLSFNGETTGLLTYLSTAGDIELALESLNGIDQVTVSGSFPSFGILFQGENELSPQLPITIATNSLTAIEKGTIDTALGVIDQKYFQLNDDIGSVGFWIDEDNSGTTIPAGAAALDRDIEITTINTGDNADTRATKIAAAINADSKFSATSLTNQVSYEASADGDRVDASDGDTGFTFAITAQGRSPGNLTGSVTETTPGVYPQADIGVTAENSGEVQAPSGTLSVIETPVSGWASVTNALDIDVGSAVEADQELKLRRLQEIAIAGKATLEAIRAALIAITEVTAVVVFENNSSLTDIEGRPPHSVDIVVENGTNLEISETIFDTVAAGIETIGAITENVTDSQGFSHAIKFSRPDEIDIYVEVDLTVDGNFPGDGDTQVEAAIVAFGDDIGIGNDVIVIPQLLCSFATIPGILDVEIRVGAAAMPVAGSGVATAADNAGTLEWTKAAHGLIDNNRITFSTTSALPTGVAAGVVYHVVNAGVNIFQISASRGGTPIVFADVGTGVHTVSYGGRDDNISIGPREVAKFDTARTDVTIL